MNLTNTVNFERTIFSA